MGRYGDSGMPVAGREEPFRVPDTMALRAGQEVDRIVQHPPLICIEVSSPEDT